MLSREQELDLCDALMHYINDTRSDFMINAAYFTDTPKDDLYRSRLLVVSVWNLQKKPLDQAATGYMLRELVFKLHCGFATYFPVFFKFRSD